MAINLLTRYGIGALSLGLLGFLLYQFSNIVTYVIVAWVVSLMGSPLMRLLRRVKVGKYSLPNSFAAALTLACFILIIGGILALFIPIFVKQAYNLALVDYRELAGALEEPFQHLMERIKTYGIPVEQANLEEIVSSFTKDWFKPGLLAESFSKFLSMASSFFVAVASVLFISFFFLQEQGLFLRFLLSLVPDKYVNQTQTAIQESISLLSRYFNGILLQMVLITIYMTLVLSVFGIKNAVSIAFFAALMNLIPYVGPIIGAGFGVLITLSSNLTLPFYSEVVPQMVTVILVFSSMQILDNYLFVPIVFSRSLEAHPLEIFIVILAGAETGGISGMVLAIPIYTVIRSFAGIFFEKFKVVQLMKRSENSSSA